MQVRILAAVAAVMLLCVPASAGTKIGDPTTFVRSLYAKLLTDRNYKTPEDIYTTRLAALFALEKRETESSPSRMQNNIWTDSADDWGIKTAKVKGEVVEGSKDRMVVTAELKSKDRKEVLQFYFEKSKDGWKLDDARSLGQNTWTLSLMLKYGWVSADQ